MKIRLKAAILCVLLTLVAGCAYVPTAPLPSEPGNASFLFLGSVQKIRFLEKNFASEIPPNCKTVTSSEEIEARDRSSYTTALYRCTKTDEATFKVFGGIFLGATGSRALKTVLAAEGSTAFQLDEAGAVSTALSMTVTTTSCDYTYCRWLNSRGPWKPNMACQQFCN
jgi:hypothetical protein